MFDRVIVTLLEAKVPAIRRDASVSTTLLAVGVAGLALLGAHTHGRTTTLPQNSQRLTPVVQAVSTAVPAVVNISTERIVRVSDPFESFFNEFFGGPVRYYRETIPLGSGIIVDPGGLVLTNHHVIKRASQIRVHLFNGESLTARYVAGDSTNDLALLQLQERAADALPLQALDFALPGDLMLGETVIAVGNPFGLEHSVSAGILSAKNRSFESGDMTFGDILQTDAAINPGNSGGPLINLDGQLVGINIAIRADAEGIGFAVPIARAESVLARWLVPSRFSLSVCGFVPGTEVLEDGSTKAIVAAVEKGTPAEVCGIKAGDVITAVNGTPVSRALEVGRFLWRVTAGGDLQLRLEGKDKALRMCVSEMAPEMLIRQRLGLQLQPLSDALLTALDLPSYLEGLAISEVREDSGFAKLNVRRGDIVFRVGDTDVRTLDDVYKALKDLTPGDSVPVFLVVVEDVRGRKYLRRQGVSVVLD